jgi:hypothetical protein
MIRSDERWEQLKRHTAEAMADPQVGDRYTEMYAFWIYVVDVGEESVTTLEASPPCTVPDDGTLRVFATRDEFRSRYTYSDPTLGYWVKLADRGHDVTGWVAAATKAAASGGSSVVSEKTHKDGGS